MTAIRNPPTTKASPGRDRPPVACARHANRNQHLDSSPPSARVNNREDGRMRIDVEPVKAQTDLASVVEASGVSLKRCGNRWVGLCPFPDERRSALRHSRPRVRRRSGPPLDQRATDKVAGRPRMFTGCPSEGELDKRRAGFRRHGARLDIRAQGDGTRSRSTRFSLPRGIENRGEARCGNQTYRGTSQETRR